MLFWQQILALEALMNERCSRIIGNRSGGGFHMRDQMRLVLFTRFGQMDLITHERLVERFLL